MGGGGGRSGGGRSGGGRGGGGRGGGGMGEGGRGGGGMGEGGGRGGGGRGGGEMGEGGMGEGGGGSGEDAGRTLSQSLLDLRVNDPSYVLRNTTIRPGSPLLVATHGYLESTQLEWVGLLREAVVGGAGVDILTVDWSPGAPPPYAQAVGNIRLVGAVIATLLHRLVEEGVVRSRDIHLMGHSLGAHLQAYTGSHFQTISGEKVGRITGLDPAGPYFTDTPPEVRLDPSDATFVDIIHTDIPSLPWQLDNLGYPDPLGHLDFYPNGGFNQAGCQGSAQVHIDKERTLAGGLVAYLGCDHQRAYRYFTQSYLNQCQFMGMVCESWEQYQAGECWGCEGDRCGVMGFPARPLTVQLSPQFQQHPPVSESDNSGSSSSQNKGSGVNNTEERREETNAKIGKMKVKGRKRRGRGRGNRRRGRKAEEKEVVPMKVFFGTGPEQPYCAEQYAVSVLTSTSPESVQGGGDLALFTVTLKSPAATFTFPTPDSATYVEAGGEVRWVGWSGDSLADVHSIQVDYEEEQGILPSLIWRFTPPTLYIEAFTVQALSTGHKQTFPFCGGKMEEGQSYSLFPDTKCDVV
ncbi:hypothetical protein Pmani_005806 [Petrolisthes manimaculis]|uniref:Lipase domain-containing protein n=1 Tax=Petrolisthes manimaculis TaxID=1843537 RepID=A0AAE1QBH0_9EUCA|nr:hypothetical protein Pmani_005806 [Petrolisthes manimaculis]